MRENRLQLKDSLNLDPNDIKQLTKRTETANSNALDQQQRKPTRAQLATQQCALQRVTESKIV